MEVAPSSTVISTSILSRVFIDKSGSRSDASHDGFVSLQTRPELVMEVLTDKSEACQIGAKLRRADGQAVEWRIFDAPLDYQAALAMMDARVAAIASGEAPEAVWLLEHPPLYTSGTSARPEDLLNPRFPVYP